MGVIGQAFYVCSTEQNLVNIISSFNLRVMMIALKTYLQLLSNIYYFLLWCGALEGFFYWTSLQKQWGSLSVSTF